MVINIHERKIHATAIACGELLLELATPQDRLWPSHAWPPMRFHGAMKVGARGGHGPIRYTVERLEPGHSVRFRFTGPKGFIGWHGFEVEASAHDHTCLRHILNLEPKGLARLTWPLIIRWLHDACVEDALDKAQDFLEGKPPREPRSYSKWVKVLRRMAKRRKPRSTCEFTMAQLEAELFDPSLR